MITVKTNLFIVKRIHKIGISFQKLCMDIFKQNTDRFYIEFTYEKYVWIL